MALKAVGKFQMDTETNSISGPKAYVESEQFQRLLAGIANNVVVREGMALGNDIHTAILVAVQTDYAAWRGMEEMAAWSHR